MADSKKLTQYTRKRDFQATPEPEPESAPTSDNTFVIQKHDASQLHYDFRLSVNGVLKSWSVPKGPSLATSEKRLAIQTEDHPLEYADFEGVIPADQYGGGTVIVWDRGTYEYQPKEAQSGRSVAGGLKQGEVSLWLSGEKIKGGYTLIRMNEKKGEWLLIKRKDEYADGRRDPVSTEPQSALSNKTNADLEGEQ